MSCKDTSIPEYKDINYSSHVSCCRYQVYFGVLKHGTCDVRHATLRLLVTLCLGVLVTSSFSFAYALNLDKVKVYFLNCDYKSAISEGEKLIAQDVHSAYSDELYYILGLSYLKENDALRASDIFEIILGEYKESRFTEEAKLGFGDSYFFRNNYEQASSIYEELLKDYPKTKLKAAIYFRLSQVGKKTGNKTREQEYIVKLKTGFPNSPEAQTKKDLFPQTSEIIAKPTSDIPVSSVSYTVQVGAFSKQENAKGLTKELKSKGYSAYIEEAVAQGKVTYKVRVGSFASRQEVVAMEKKLSREGYSTKIFP